MTERQDNRTDNITAIISGGDGGSGRFDWVGGDSGRACVDIVDSDGSRGGGYRVGGDGGRGGGDGAGGDGSDGGIEMGGTTVAGLLRGLFVIAAAEVLMESVVTAVEGVLMGLVLKAVEEDIDGALSDCANIPIHSGSNQTAFGGTSTGWEVSAHKNSPLLRRSTGWEGAALRGHINLSSGATTYRYGLRRASTS